jgi:hypothetical protein
VRQAELAAGLLDRGRDEVAVLGLALVAGVDQDLAPLRALLDGDQPSARAVRQGAVDAEHLLLLLADDLHDPAGVAMRAVLADGLGADQHAVADAGHRRAGAGLSRHGDDDLRRGTEAVGVPLLRLGDEVAVAVAGFDARHDHVGQAPGLLYALAAA